MADEIDPNIPPQVAQFFATLDDNQDGLLDRREFAALLDELGSGLTATRRNVCFDRIDDDGNGRISLTEFAAWWQNGRPQL